MAKQTHISLCRKLEDIPNIGVSLAQDLRDIGIQQPLELVGRDPYQLYDALCRFSGARQDPCVYDVFIAAVRFAEGGAATPWWHFTAERKQALALRETLNPQA